MLARPVSTPGIAQSSLPPGWEVAHDEASGLPYYFNYDQSLTSWLPPKAGGPSGLAGARPKVANTSASRRDAAVIAAQGRKKAREAQTADWKAREEALKKVRAEAHARVDDGEDEEAVSNTRGGALPAPLASPAAAGPRADTGVWPGSATEEQAIPIEDRRSWLASQPKTAAVTRGAANVADYIACLSREMAAPVEPVRYCVAWTYTTHATSMV